ncbi:hypothetical protein LCGC14_1365390 [marine sediment metagenome]|uniref:Uncharacterized protein n=1 Tax=marine sediment metagenome TaxID=412755 RepID=A0A0F9K6Z4_9ZZZZ
MKKTLADKYMDSPLFYLAKLEVYRQGKIPIIKDGNKKVYDIKNTDKFLMDILDKMLELVRLAHKNGQKKQLDTFLKESMR